jgi:uncharacterized protein (DUF4415 family)
MLYSGMEAGNKRRLSFFDKDCIDWNPDKIAVLYSKLTHLRMQNPALWSLQAKTDFQLLSTDRDEKIICYKRESAGKKVMVALNLSNDQVEFRFTGNGYQGKYNDILNEMQVLIGDTPCFSLEAWGYRVWEGVSVG